MLNRVILKESCAENSLLGLGKSVLIVMSDGGHDHRLAYGSVQVALMCVFFPHLNCDILIAVSTCSYQS